MQVQTIEAYIVEIYFQVDRSSSFRDFLKRLFCGGEVGDGSGDMNAICRQSEMADDVISFEDG